MKPSLRSSFEVVEKSLGRNFSSKFSKAMADAECSHPFNTEEYCEEKKLKYLEFVELTAVYALFCFCSVYEYAKENAGVLKPGVQTVEEAVKMVTGPVFEKFQNIPFQLLKFVDNKVDESFSEFDRYVPRLFKTASNKAISVATEVQRAGLVDAARGAYAKYEPIAEEVYHKYEPVAEQYAVAAWRLLNRLPVVPQVAEIVVPTAAYWSEKYNQAVCYTADKGFPVAAHLPLIPTERIAMAFEEADHQYGCPDVSRNAGDVCIEQ